MYKKIGNRQGFTVIELIVAIAIASIMIIISINLLGLTNKTHSLSLKEYDLQSSIRRALEETNQVARYSKAVFAVPQTFVADTSKMDPDWNYIMVSPDGKKIISMEYDASEDKEEFVERVLVPEHKNIRYEIFFEKEPEAEADNVIRYVINAYIVDKNGNKTNEKAVYETTIESVNAVQVADKGTGIPEEGAQGASPSIALAYRSIGKTSGKGRKDLAYITLVVDISGSMNEKPDGDTTDNEEESRIYLVKEALTGYGTDKGGIIQHFANEENIHISLVPFSDTANYPYTTGNTEPHAVHEIYKGHHDNSRLVGKIEALIAKGGTNTGDGLRRAYHLHKNFRTTMDIDENTQIHHYMILLVDGQTTYENTAKIKWIYEGFLFFGTWNIIEESIEYFVDDGNIPINHHSPSGGFFTGTIYEYNNLNIIGNGFTTISNSKYVKTMGNKINEFENKNESEIKSYIIGYAANLKDNINEIGAGMGTDPNKIYSYTNSSDFDISEVLQNIADDIMADFWIVSGPQIQD